MRVCDYVVDFLKKHGIDDIFTVTGGGAIFLDDALACNKEINTVCCHHEQAVAMAATAYAKYKGLGCAIVTTGCGGTNAMTGLLDAWQDNVPCIFISGQCKRKETIRYSGIPLRQFGVQEVDIVALVEPITKYATMVTNPDDIVYEMEKAIAIAEEGRPGPVWIDLPMDIQSAQIDPDQLRHFDGSFERPKATMSEIEEIVKDLNSADRPVIIAGHGLRSAGALDDFYSFIHSASIPVVFTGFGVDTMPTTDDLCVGKIGNKGTRAAHFAMRNADHILVLGSRLSVSSTGQQYEFFAPRAKVTVVDIDRVEHSKNTVHIESLVISDLKYAIERINEHRLEKHSDWANQCLFWKQKYPVCLPEYKDDTDGVNVYEFIDQLSSLLKDDSVMVTDAGSTHYVPSQGLKTTSRNQRFIPSCAQLEMGGGLPAAIGISVAKGGDREVLAISGDGGLQMNIQELQTLKYYQFPVKLIVWNNDGYLSIRATQRKLFDGRLIGTDGSCGVSFPDLEKIAFAYGIRYIRIDKVNDIRPKMAEALCLKEPVIIEVMSIKDQPIVPAIGSKQVDGVMVSAPPEDMVPFLSREEFESNILD